MRVLLHFALQQTLARAICKTSRQRFSIHSNFRSDLPILGVASENRRVV